ncbi:hypothetical protein HHI36_022226 [Cryptolaemus montrouzieri]|uniref:Uncharacterized protein n=1 Tax=Cryptolaemus montrouzieri TaxID=559131 RepID=A0ABD2MZF6_9CUCU
MLIMLQSLEEYIVDMENRSAIQKPSSTSNVNEDLWTQLQQKENDLVLAAELGKALLDKNEELKKQQEALAEDYQKKLEESSIVYLKILDNKEENDLKKDDKSRREEHYFKLYKRMFSSYKSGEICKYKFDIRVEKKTKRKEEHFDEETEDASAVLIENENCMRVIRSSSHDISTLELVIQRARTNVQRLGSTHGNEIEN